MKACSTPIIKNRRLNEHLDQLPTNKRRYQRLVGKLIYLSHTRPDIAYAASIVSQYIHNPGENNMDAVIQILRYLKFFAGKGLMFTKNKHLLIEGFTDED